MLAIGTITSIAFSQGFGRGKGRNGMGFGMMNQAPARANLTQEQTDKLQGLRLNFDKETLALRNDINARSAELQKLWSADSLDENAIIAKDKELMSLRNQMHEKMIRHHLDIAKILPKEQRSQPAFGRGMGYGNHLGMGKRHGNRSGMGRGYCNW